MKKRQHIYLAKHRNSSYSTLDKITRTVNLYPLGYTAGIRKKTYLRFILLIVLRFLRVFPFYSLYLLCPTFYGIWRILSIVQIHCISMIYGQCLSNNDILLMPIVKIQCLVEKVLSPNSKYFRANSVRKWKKIQSAVNLDWRVLPAWWDWWAQLGVPKHNSQATPGSSAYVQTKRSIGISRIQWEKGTFSLRL